MNDSFEDAKPRNSTIQLFRYGLVGIASNLTGYLIFVVFTYLGITPKIAMTVLYAVGAFIGFAGNRQWTFAHKGSLISSAARYFVAHFFGYLINLIILFSFVDVLGYSHLWVQAVAIFVVAGFLFVVFKYVVFSESKDCIRCSE